MKNIEFKEYIKNNILLKIDVINLLNIVVIFVLKQEVETEL